MPNQYTETPTRNSRIAQQVAVLSGAIRQLLQLGHSQELLAAQCVKLVGVIAGDEQRLKEERARLRRSALLQVQARARHERGMRCRGHRTAPPRA